MFQTTGHLDYDNKWMSDPCDKYITDYEYLKHMIPHHQVAIDMAKKIMEVSSDPNILYLARNIRFKQADEILFMENAYLSAIPNSGSGTTGKIFIRPTSLGVYYPNYSKDKNAKCGIHHFNPKLIHHSSNKITDISFLKHMIPHHQVAVDMSKRLLKHSSNHMLTQFAYEVIKGQEYEIFFMKQLLESPYKNYSYMFR
jgi:uncharacterized protein (DUF305 family)